MDTRADYAKMCQMAGFTWKPQMGDWFVLKATYCYEEEDCTEKDPCLDCLRMSNKYVISGDHAGKIFFFGTALCNCDGGRLLDSTQSAILYLDTTVIPIDTNLYLNYVSDCIWLPRQDQLIEMLSKMDPLEIVWRTFITWCSLRTEVVGETLEQFWLRFYMYQEQKKIWNGEKWVLMPEKVKE